MSISIVEAGIWICLVAVSYLIGNISPAILIGRACGIDIKKEGSGNAGTTNVLRVLGKKAAVATLAIDILKGVAAVLAARLTVSLYGGIAGSEALVNLYPEYLPALCAIAVLCGHIWPVFFGFKGGKGVATAFGTLVTLSPAMGLSALGIVFLIVAVTKRVSAGSVCGALCVPFLAYIFIPEFIWGAIVMAVIVVIKHRANIGRLVRGEEPKLSFKK